MDSADISGIWYIGSACIIFIEEHNNFNISGADPGSDPRTPPSPKLHTEGGTSHVSALVHPILVQQHNTQYSSHMGKIKSKWSNGWNLF